jgi:hypothetical protein
MKRTLAALTAFLAVIVPVVTATAADRVDDVLRELNQTRSVEATEESKSYKLLLDAVLETSDPPMPLGSWFNHTTIHADMSRWSEVSGWAESNPELAEAILAAKDKTLFGLPYGAEQVESRFREAGLVAQIAVRGSLREQNFGYLDAVDKIAAYAVAEAHRLFEAGKTQEALDLYVANLFVLRQTCDREFLTEQFYCIELLRQALGNLRNMYYVYLDQISADQFAAIAMQEIPFLRPDRARLFMPEGDRVVSEALIKDVFDDLGQPDPEAFGETFAAIQSQDKPLTRFGAAKRWRKIAEVHDSRQASLERLQLVYDDWWRRWRVEEYDPILSISTEFERTNPIRYAAVIYSMQNIEQLFGARNHLMAEVYGTAVATGLCGYKRSFGTYPPDTDMTYASFMRKRSDQDPFDREFLPFRYRLVDGETPIDTPLGRIWLEDGSPLLWSKGPDHLDDRGSPHAPEGLTGDIVMWPPIEALQREADLLD